MTDPDINPALQLDCQGEEWLCVDPNCLRHPDPPSNPPSTSSSIISPSSSAPSSPNYMDIEDAEEDIIWFTEEERKSQALLQLMQELAEQGVVLPQEGDEWVAEELPQGGLDDWGNDELSEGEWSPHEDNYVELHVGENAEDGEED